MLYFILILFLLLWFLGYVAVPLVIIPDLHLITINGELISLYDLLLFILAIWAVGILPSPLRQIASALIVLWVLSTLGFIVVAGLSELLIFAIIVGILVALFQK